MLRRVSDRLGLGLAWPPPGLEDEDADAVIEIPPPRPGMLVYLEGEDDPHRVRSVEPSRKDPDAWRATFLDGSFLDPWPDQVEDVGQPWPPFATAAELAELEDRRATAAEDAAELGDALERLGPPVLTLTDAEGRQVDPAELQPMDVIATVTVEAHQPDWLEALDQAARADGLTILVSRGPHLWDVDEDQAGDAPADSEVAEDAPISAEDAATVISAARHVLEDAVDELATFAEAQAEGEAPARSEGLVALEDVVGTAREALEDLGELTGRLLVEPEGPLFDVVACVLCGCTDDHACPGGCSWALGEPPLCSRCAVELVKALAPLAAELRAELVQVGAMALGWLARIDAAEARALEDVEPDPPGGFAPTPGGDGPGAPVFLDDDSTGRE